MQTMAVCIQQCSFHRVFAILITLSIADPGWQDDPTLFSSIWARYQRTLELLQHNGLDDAASGDFAARHHSGSYLCRYRSCPRATQGFSSWDLRQKHESSHAPRFRCTDPACGFFGRALKSHVTMNKHTIKYHRDDSLTTIPTSLRKASTRPQQDRPRFSLKELSSASRKRSFHAAEEDKVMSEVDVAINPASKIRNPRPLLDEDQEEFLIKCICGFKDDDGNIVLCELCKTWQRIQCYHIDEHGNVLDASGLVHFCVDCNPRPLDAKGAAGRQMKRKAQPLEYLRTVAMARDEAKKKEWQESPRRNTSGGRVTSSYWSVPEQEDLRKLIRRYGTNWEAIADNMKIKAHTIV